MVMTLGTMMLPTITAKIMSRPGKVIRASGYAVSAHAATVASVVSTDTSALFQSAIVMAELRVPDSTPTYWSSVAGIGSQKGTGSRIIGVILNEVTSAQKPGANHSSATSDEHGAPRRTDQVRISRAERLPMLGVAVDITSDATDRFI